MRAVRDQVTGIARECGVSQEVLHDIRLGVSEVITNAIVHAYAESEGEVRVEIYHEDDEMLIVVADDGPGMAPRIESPGMGLGLPVVASVARRLELVSLDGGGTEVHMVFPCPAGLRRVGP